MTTDQVEKYTGTHKIKLWSYALAFGTITIEFEDGFKCDNIGVYDDVREFIIHLRDIGFFKKQKSLTKFNVYIIKNHYIDLHPDTRYVLGLPGGQLVIAEMEICYKQWLEQLKKR